MAKRGRPRKRPAAQHAVPAVASLPEHSVTPLDKEIISKLALRGDLSGLTPEQKVIYYMKFCEHLHLDPVTRPFDILDIRGKQVLYAHKGATDQLRKNNGVSVTDIKKEQVNDIYVVTVIGQDRSGRTDASTGAVNLRGLEGDDLANAIMKAETKAKRRLTLSLCGLGMLDETEVETIRDARPVTIETISPRRLSETRGDQHEPGSGDEVYELGSKNREAGDSAKGNGRNFGGSNSGDGTARDHAEGAEANPTFSDIVHKLNASKMDSAKKIEIMKRAREVRDDTNALRSILRECFTDQL